MHYNHTCETFLIVQYFVKQCVETKFHGIGNGYDLVLKGIVGGPKTHFEL